MQSLNQYVGYTIKQIRKERGLSQEVLSGLAGIARTHLTMIESGQKLANFDTLCRIAYALEIKPSELVKEIEIYSETHKNTL